jgi:hypothetical protein
LQRKLAAILCADVFGYSRLMGEDELVRAPAAAIAAGSVSSLARTSAGGRCDGAVIGQKYGFLRLLGHGICRLHTLAFLLS